MVKTLLEIIKDIESDEYNSEEYNKKGLDLIGNWNFSQAERLFRALLKKEGDKNKGRNLNNLGLALKYKGYLKEAEKMFKEAYEWDIKKVGKEKAKLLPAFQNLEFLRKNRPAFQKEKRIPIFVRKFKKPHIIIPTEVEHGKRYGKVLNPIKIFYVEILVGGVIGGLMIYSIQEFLSLFNSAPFLKWAIFLAILLLALAILDARLSR